MQQNLGTYSTWPSALRPGEEARGSTSIPPRPTPNQTPLHLPSRPLQAPHRPCCHTLRPVCYGCTSPSQAAAARLSQKRCTTLRISCTARGLTRCVDGRTCRGHRTTDKEVLRLHRTALLMRITSKLGCSPCAAFHAAAPLSPASPALHPTQAPRYTLYRALRSTFAWVAQHAPLRVQHLPQLPTHDATWPDVDDPADLVAALGAALIDETQLGGVGRELEAATQGRLSGQALAALVPRISGALAELHRGLADLWEVAEAVYSAQWKLRTEAVMAQPQAAAAAAAVAPAAARLAAAGRAAESRARRRQLRAVPPNFRYAMPPGFTPAPPGQLPQLLVPLVFHVLSAMSEPAGVSSSPGYVDRWVRLVNIMAKPTNFQFSVQVGQE